MFWIGVLIGGSISSVVVWTLEKKTDPFRIETKRLEREIAADNLACAREERRAAALRVIAENERQATEGTHEPKAD